MNVLGIVCEYNPFHNGHALQLARARRETGADFVICAMSGAFVQRGEPAMTDKWSRAYCALSHGADLVVELPYAWAAAPDFARGAIRLLAALGAVTHVGFGSELPLEALREAAARREDTAQIRAALARGESYPRAVHASAASALPNATLGLEYLRAMEGTGLIPHVTMRDTGLASASETRAAIREGADVRDKMPPEVRTATRQALEEQGGPAGWNPLLPLLLHTLRTADSEGIYGTGEGLHRRLAKAAKTARSVEELFALAKCKRYTMARLRRAAACALLGIPAALAHEPPRCARVLGFRRGAEPLLRAIQRQGIPLVTKLPRAIEDPLLAASVRAQEMWALACPTPLCAGMDYRHPIVRIGAAPAASP